jgi:hypothetical protein
MVLLYRQDSTSPQQAISSIHSTIAAARLVDGGVNGVLFSSWQDQGGETFTAISLDHGETWKPARVIYPTIALRAATIVPGEQVTQPAPKHTAGSDSRVRIVQFETQSLTAWRQRLVELGAELLAFIPHNAHIVRMSSGVERNVAGEPFVRWVGAYHPAYRLEPALLDELNGPNVPPRRFVLQTFQPGPAEKAALASEIVAAGGEIVSQTPHGYLLEAMLTSAQALALLHSNNLQWLEPWMAPSDDMDNARVVLGADSIEISAGYDGSGVRAEVMDSGVMQTHQDFDGILFHGGSPSSGDHGTCTYGIVFGNGDRDGDGDGTATGMLPAAVGYFADYDNLFDRYQHTSELVTSPIEASFQSNSWGNGRTLHYTALSAEMDDILWTYDIPIFQSQSNSGDQYSRPQAWAKNIISVGGVNHYNNQDSGDDCWCSTASIGPAEDGRVKPDLTAWYDSTWTTDQEPGGYGAGLYANFGGTSGATPMTAGAGGLILQMYADNIYGNNPGIGSVFDKRPHSATFKAIMINTAAQYSFSGLDHDHTRARQGWGLPDLQAVFDRAGLTQIVDESSVLSELEFDTYSATVNPGQSTLRATLVYADRAGSPAATIHRVNDVTLKVVAPDGTVYWGNNGLDIGVWSIPGGQANTVDTVENVFIENPMAGDWQIEVWADEINMDVHIETPEDDQDYALVVYGATTLDECRSQVAAPTGLSVMPNGDNKVSLSWSGTAPLYEVWRAEGGCGLPAELVATVNTTSYDDVAVAGGVTFGYLVRAVDGCPSFDSSCIDTSTTGPCDLAPTFEGLAWAVGSGSGSCGVDLSWSDGTGRCGGTAAYNVYRSTDPAFTPSGANRVASCLTGTSLTDSTVPLADQTYHYIVRAEDLASTGAGPCGGVEDENLIRRSLTATTLVYTDFESGLDGWTSVIPTISVTGEFVVDDPKGTIEGAEQAQPEDAAFGSACLFTGRNPAATSFQADVDYGEVEAISPTFDASGLNSVQLDLWRWFYNRDLGEDSQDYFAIDVSNNGGSTWTNLETLDTNTSENVWTQVVFNLESFVALTDNMVVRVRASDGASTGNIIEAAIDEVIIRSLDSCTGSALFTDGFESGDTGAWTVAVP